MLERHVPAISVTEGDSSLFRCLNGGEMVYKVLVAPRNFAWITNTFGTPISGFCNKIYTNNV